MFAQKDKPSMAMPPSAIPTFSTESIARQGFFYAGGKYVGGPGKEIMGDAMYTEVWVPKQMRHPYPVVFFHGNGQSGAVWRQTPDGRPGWAYYLVEHGYSVYMVDYPARGRSPYVPGRGRQARNPHGAGSRRRSGRGRCRRAAIFRACTSTRSGRATRRRRARWAIRCSTTLSRARCSL